MKTLGIILLVIILSIAIPTREEWSYKAMYDRNIEQDIEYYWGGIPRDNKRKK